MLIVSVWEKIRRSKPRKGLYTNGEKGLEDINQNEVIQLIEEIKDRKMKI